jgi:hypothetical protein
VYALDLLSSSKKSKRSFHSPACGTAIQESNQTFKTNEQIVPQKPSGKSSKHITNQKEIYQYKKTKLL